ncbi:A/G-specific adenine glycosylase [Rhabdothermincola salaria]|uniref:A/G-specific adenine glycosylase n=1 Tax=Rhabdothermincola salaria TaxID=2903142 RepID=UPI001E40BA0C|nr:A/G-specific adenine glycosylase [Rhabdothermincola salaria]MCD9623447.1 A/G-specific adenine glycosylase [Rhabdothermincola salaria]
MSGSRSQAEASHEVLGWWEATRRDLPWRRTRDPWAVLVSEVMLQQTQVDRVVPRWRRFLDRFPDVESCVAAGSGAVVEEWAGLGYNRRAVALHGCAAAVLDDHDGTFPDDLPALLALPGVGPYTARAVLAFAFERDVAVVDTNVGRILARTAGTALTARQAQAAADELVPEGEGWQWNQALLDLGATVCTKRSPACERCPVASTCRWWQAGRPDPDPALGSHAVSRPQSRFEGSFRQGRARLLDALRAGQRPDPSQWRALCDGRADTEADVGPADGSAASHEWTDDSATRAAESLVRDRLATFTADGRLTLPS